MTDQEKELIAMFKFQFKLFRVKYDDEFLKDLSCSLVHLYPQILAEKVWEGQSCLIESEQFTGTDGKNKLSLVWSNTNEKVNKTIEVFIREVKE